MHKIFLKGRRGVAKWAIIDDEDYSAIRQYSWYLNTNGYAFRNAYKNGRNTTNLMHRDILKLYKNYPYIDHKDNNPLNNQKSNLRTCTQSENMQNMLKKRPNATSKFKGVRIYFDRWGRKYIQARIQINGKRVTIGYYKTEKEAAMAYNLNAEKYFKEFAKLNLVT